MLLKPEFVETPLGSKKILSREMKIPARTLSRIIKQDLKIDSYPSETATNNIPHVLEIKYGSTSGQKLDILGTDLPNDAIIFVWIHGGYWQAMSRSVSRYPALSLHPEKIKTIVVGYDLCPNASLPDIVDQVQNAAKYILEYAEKMGSRGVYFAGHSAGAHLVAKLLSNEQFLKTTIGANRLRGAFLVSGVYDLRDLVKTYVNDLVRLPEQKVRQMSPYFDDYTHLQNINVRVYILAGQNDSPTFKKQSRDFYEKLQISFLSNNVYLEIKDNFDHFDIVECYAKGDNFLKSLLLLDFVK
ncbi:hypothetical protein K1T71_003139 [Dendrolimus kikuchii]|uniref:Uncharacterized protein n=1 Tax=Dendrolimus kikuchii TaxID=765133 RepID=A0ACC1DAQ4_9NEOP|nr:hypothetical protein K1T71_003139 [Dendrolimus kikuchii]